LWLLADKHRKLPLNGKPIMDGDHQVLLAQINTVRATRLALYGLSALLIITAVVLVLVPMQPMYANIFGFWGPIVAALGAVGTTGWATFNVNMPMGSAGKIQNEGAPVAEAKISN
jgi:hypothetical protein